MKLLQTHHGFIPTDKISRIYDVSDGVATVEYVNAEGTQTTTARVEWNEHTTQILRAPGITLELGEREEFA